MEKIIREGTGRSKIKNVGTGPDRDLKIQVPGNPMSRRLSKLRLHYTLCYFQLSLDVGIFQKNRLRKKLKYFIEFMQYP